MKSITEEELPRAADLGSYYVVHQLGRAAVQLSVRSIARIKTW
jgi:hypothetical protein